jgi:hypothetical protein
MGQEHGAESIGQRAWGREHRAESIGQRAWGRGQRAKDEGRPLSALVAYKLLRRSRLDRMMDEGKARDIR